MEPSEMTDIALDYIFGWLDHADPNLTKWEQSFIESVSDQWIRRRSLSEKQKEILGKIWDKIP